MTFKVIEATSKDEIALVDTIVNKWNKWYNARNLIRDEDREVREYLTATVADNTSNRTNPWTSNTVIPKLAQIRDNLHSNYLTSTFPNEQWLEYEAFTTEDSDRRKAAIIEGYLGNKLREPASNFRRTISRCLLDYIDFGNAFLTTDYLHKTQKDEDGTEQVVYSGPVVRRIHPHDINFDLTADNFDETPVIVRALKTVGEVELDIMYGPDSEERMKSFKRAMSMRGAVAGGASAADVTRETTDRYLGLYNDGFGNYTDYLDSGLIELLTYMGDIYDIKSQTTMRNQKIVIMDRQMVLFQEDIPDWVGRNIYHAPWRIRQENLWGQGPLHQLVGLQYSINHRENQKSNALDISVFPPVKVRGDVNQDISIQPFAEIHMDENADVDFMRIDNSSLQMNTEIHYLMDLMELMAGAPREALGMRSPGEKTKFEVQQLASAASKVFQLKVTDFEINILEPALNSLLDKSIRNIQPDEMVRALDKEFGIEEMLSITREDLAGKGKIRPIGARHFVERANSLQELVQLASSPLWAKIQQHFSGVNLATTVEDYMNLERLRLVRPNVALAENAESMKLNNTLQDGVDTDAITNPDEEEAVAPPEEVQQQ